MKTPCLFVSAFLVVAAAAFADVSLPGSYGSHMVLQREHPIRVRGWADPGETVTVTQGSAVARAVAGADRRWSVELPAHKAGEIPDLVVQGKNKLVLDDLLAGDVWLCSGQSNMEFKLPRAEGGAAAVAAAKYPRIRLFTVGRKVATTPQDDTTGDWAACTPETAAKFSAVGYFFGLELHQRLDVPIGLIHASWGGTAAEAWVSAEVTRPDSDYASLYKEWADYRANYAEIKAKYEADMKRWEERTEQAKVAGTKQPVRPLSKPHPDENHQYPGHLFNGMISPLVGQPIKGVAWYQGETNAKRANQYRKLLTSLIKDWRQRWGQGDFPFMIVSLANFHALEAEPPAESQWASLREAQAQVAQEVPAAGLALAIDVGQADDIHPLNKREVGRRLAISALSTAYGQKLVACGPTLAKAEIGKDAVRIRYKDTGGGLSSGRDGKAEKLSGFALAGADKKWVWADARIEGDTVLVSSPAVKAPAFARYGWADNPGANLYNREGLPAAPFRTDKD